MEDKGSLDNSLDEVRQQIQESLIESKRERLREEYGMQHDYMNPDSPPEIQNEFFDYVMEFERQLDEGKTITVRERLGNPPVRPLAEIPAEELGAALDALMELMYEHNLVVDFLGAWDDRSGYQHVTEELLDHEIDDIRIQGTYCHLEAVTPEYEVESWVEELVQALFWQARDHLLAMMEPQQLYNGDGEPLALADFEKKLEEVWARLPDGKVNSDFRPLSTEIGKDEAVIAALITWQQDDEHKEIEVTFWLQPSPYYGWDIVQTSLLDTLLTTLR